nr:immunoglobulin heavy chain junction region [Mus musculus]
CARWAWDGSNFDYW